MDNTPRVRVVCHIDTGHSETETVELPDDDVSVEMPGMMAAYLHERRRAIITELRRIEELLQMQSSLPRRTRPH